MSSLNRTFDTVADTYEKLRPGYVDELYQAIFEYKPINNLSRVVEIGICGGQATFLRNTKKRKGTPNLNKSVKNGQ